MLALAMAALTAPNASLHAQSAVRHPLDGFSSQEYWTIYEVLRDAKLKDTSSTITEVGLHAPPKADVLAWRAGQSLPREARVVLRAPKRTIEAIVSLDQKKVLSERTVAGAQATFTSGDFEAGSELIKKDPRVRAALQKRGVTDMSMVRCGGGPPSYFPNAKTDGRRIIRGGCRIRSRVYNTWSRQFEGLIATVDLDEKKVIDVIDTGIIPPATNPTDFDEEAIGATRPSLPPIQVSLPQGAGYTITGSEIAWDKWKFHLRLDPRVGAVYSLVRINDGGRERSVMYEGALSEIFVPYQDSTTGWYDRTFLDVGEYSAEGLLERVEAGVDCPTYATLIDGLAASGYGSPTRKRGLACVFERSTGVVAWRHGEDGGDRVDGKAARELVVRTSATIGNYDYLLDWVFKQDGGITVSVGATGILETRVVKSVQAGTDDRFGTLLDKNVLGVNHDHFFSFRLDMDVDGAANSLSVGKLIPERLPEAHARRSIWRVEEMAARTEKDGIRDMDMHRPETWRIVSGDAKGPLGYPTSYEIASGHNAMTLMSDDDWPQKRASFSLHQLWTTPREASERFAAGDFPTLSTAAEGLPQWTAKNRNIANTDIVAWFTMGFHHVPRAEDWPVMPTAWHSFEIRPFNFFARNPVMDLPRIP